MIQFEILTLFPELFHSFLSESLVHKALGNQHIGVELTNFRQNGIGRHQRVDDLPYGGGPGMVLKIEPIYHTIQQREAYYREQNKTVHKILLTPQGCPFTQKKAKEFYALDRVLMLICGRYEGFDERVRLQVDEEVSGGDFVCLGGEVIAMMMIEVIGRLVPGVIGNQDSLEQESFAHDQLEYPHYTRPPDFQGMAVPEVLLSGNHQVIENWRKEQSLLRTLKRRPELKNREKKEGCA
ncbi:tRNA (guanosine(37)-N1)-methyltransferase TrmD [Deltaproteobacteria bacterium TL4]